ncbi:MAG: acetoin utilization protein AcuC [Betaproteobacteria bacterium]|nr:acetoin utilization protein AcuC [Betaproteobacteria bacterium]
MKKYRATLINAVTRRQRPYRSNHPLAIPRTALAIDLIRAYGAVTEREILPGRIAAVGELAWFHTADYIAAMRAAEANGRLREEDRERHQLGTLENPYFDGLFSIPARATGGSIQAAEAVLAGRIAFNPAGGMHHARAGAAQGFCYFNDPVLAILKLRQAGWRTLYVDIDAHHGDGVEEAFESDPDVFTFSLHMGTAYAYPYRGGAVSDSGDGKGGHTVLNIPLPPGTHDAEYRMLFDSAWAKVVARFAPDVIVLQAGTDLLARDPLGKLSVSTECFLGIARTVLESAPRHADGTPRLLVTGGGGYHPLLLARAWTGLWALLSGRELPEEIPASGAEAMRGANWRLDEDEPYFADLFRFRLDRPTAMQVRPSARELAAAVARHPFLR